nr:Ig-like domain-containing protein [Oscillochloris sp. ZM17-4]
MADGGSVSPSGSTYTVSLAAGSIFTLTNVPIPAPADTRSPTVTFTAPAEGATVSGANVQIAVSVSDNVGVAGVQFKLDGANLGVEQSASSPSLSWNSTGVVNGGHTFDAIARDAAGNTASATRSITVSNASYTSVQYLPLLEQ